MLTIQRYDAYLSPLDEREEWEGTEPDTCIEELQPKQQPISDSDMIAPAYEEVQK